MPGADAATGVDVDRVDRRWHCDGHDGTMPGPFVAERPMSERHEAILSYWFGGDAADRDDGAIAGERMDLWFRADDTVDAEIEAEFGALLQLARRGECDTWGESPRGRLALIVLLDQFSRNIFRDTPDAFASDRLALAHSLEGQTQDQDLALRPVERLFFYMPMMHAESLPVQDRAVQRFEELVAAVPEPERPPFERSLKAAREHRDTILRFDRFPHRNRILNRESTPAETDFLERGHPSDAP